MITFSMNGAQEPNQAPVEVVTNLDDYQQRVMQTAIYPQEVGLVYTILGLASEAGEVAGKYKKIIRDKNGIIDEEAREMFISEVGDVLWYVAAVAKELGVNLSYVSHKNLEKLNSRKQRGVLGGSGDTR